ncbi:MAG: hypothetical protein IAF94_11030 [Pirellulaceae bacterium]|nr:hypothetical protein [Pirellulaceae bacterium]
MIRRQFPILLVGSYTAICFGVLASGAALAKDADENNLHEVSADFSSPTRLRKTLLTGGGLIERVTDNVILLNTGDEVVLAEETQVLVSPGKFGPVPKGATRADLSPGTPVTYEIRLEKDYKVHRIFIAGKRLEPTAAQQNYARLMEIVGAKKLKETNRYSTNYSTQRPLQTPGIDGPVKIRPGEIKLVELKEATLATTIGWEEFPEKVGNEEPFRFLLVEWLANGTCNMTFYAEK